MIASNYSKSSLTANYCHVEFCQKKLKKTDFTNCHNKKGIMKQRKTCNVLCEYDF